MQRHGRAATVISLQKEVQLQLSHMAAFRTIWESYSTELTNLETMVIHVWLDFMILNVKFIIVKMKGGEKGTSQFFHSLTDLSFGELGSRSVM